MKHDTLVILTGGTIDAEAYPDPKNPPPDATMLPESLVPKTLEELGHGARCEIKSWIIKDSKYFTPQELDQLADLIDKSGAKNIVITHGTDAMADNSRHVLQALRQREKNVPHTQRGQCSLLDKRIMFTGAMIPLANGAVSDGRANLDYILSHMDDWAPGVRVVMGKQSFDPVGLEKDFKTYTFKGRLLNDQPSTERLA